MAAISRILVANRGEIAVRIIRACKELGIETVAAVSEADKESLPAKQSDQTVCIGPSHALDSYLRIGTLITAAIGTQSDAIHPGYGFLAEQPEMAETCEKHDLLFIGPSPKSLRVMGNKLLARETVKKINVPTIPGSEKVKDFEAAVLIAENIGFPILLKAAAGGGGRGIVIVRDSEKLKTVFNTVSAEAQAAFGDGTLYIEKYIPNARHIEVQIVADQFGNVIHIGERDCSVQRRYQKVIEEAPSPGITPKLRADICKAAVDIAKSINYESIGTVEFVFDQDNGKFYFLEMNTRIQVEHPVTEQISGVDLVKEQINVAAGRPVSISQTEVSLQGHAIECRINAELAEADFRPSPGKITQWKPPEGNGVRVDTHCFAGYSVPPFYDSLLAKVIVSGNDRSEAIEHMRSALKQFSVSGVDTTIPFLSKIIDHTDFLSGNINTRWIEDVIFTSGE